MNFWNIITPKKLQSDRLLNAAANYLEGTGSLDKSDLLLLKTLRKNKKNDNYRLLAFVVSKLDIDNQQLMTEELLREFILKNKNHLRATCLLMSKLSRLWRHNEAVELGAKLISDQCWDQRLLVEFTEAYVVAFGTNKAREALVNIITDLQLPRESILANALLLELEGNYDDAVRALTLLLSSDQHDRYVIRQANQSINRLAILRTSYHILHSRELKAPIKGVVIIPDMASQLSQLWGVPVAAELRSRGYATIVLQKNAYIKFDPTGIAEVDLLQGVLDPFRIRLNIEEEESVVLRHEWVLDVNNKTIRVDDFNFFQSICARIGTKLKQYRFDWEHPVSKAYLKESMYQGDAALSICEYLEKEVASKGLAVRILSGMSHYSPATVYRQYCAKSQLDMEYIGFVAAYQHYYSNLSNTRSTAISVQNLTRNPSLHSPGRVTRASFEKWMLKLENREDALAEVRAIVKFDRAGGTSSVEAQAVRERVLKHRENGGKVVCIFGKIMYDIWMDETGGTAHSDIVEWLNHSIECVKDSDTLLLIKPHPNEIKSHIARPKEFFVDLISTPTNDNVIVLDHKWFNMDAVVSLIDLGVVWSGTSALELQASGIPCMVCSSWGVEDHPIKFFFPESRERYREALIAPDSFVVDETMKEESALLIKYYSTSEVIIPHAFGVMPYLIGDKKEEISWDQPKVDDFIVNGDDYVSRTADKIE